MRTAAAATLVALLTATPAISDEFTAALQAFYENEIADMASNETLVSAVAAQNVETMSYTLDQIEALDQAWRAEVGSQSTPTITPVLENATADVLRDQVDAFGGRITEIFVMDAQGLNVAASAVTSDFWQGDEAKHSETYGVGAGAVHISDIELDESTQRYQGQISFPVLDPASGEPIGAITVGVDAQSLM
ncbi:MAG: hypothetical protein AAF762_03930 [Pseudomonadota bacterium]